MSEETIRVKEQKVDEIVEMFKDAKSVVLVDYRGITVEEANRLRNEFRNEGVVYRVMKNSAGAAAPPRNCRSKGWTST